MISHNKPTLGKEEKQAVLRVIDSGWLSQGKEVKEFEDAICELYDLSEGHAVAVSSGTAAIYLVLIALESNIVAYPVYSCVAIRNAVEMAHAESELLDIKRETPNADIGSIEKSDTVIVPHMFGIRCKLPKNILVIEDFAQCIDGELEGGIGIFSFYATKLITSGGQGGMVISRNKGIIDFIRDYRDFDMKLDGNRFNFQMTDLQASVGIEQLKKLPYFLERRNYIFERYRERLGLVGDKVDAIRYRAVIRHANPREFIERLRYRGVEAIIPITSNELLEIKPNANEFSETTVSLPIYPSLAESEINSILEVIDERT